MITSKKISSVLFIICIIAFLYFTSTLYDFFRAPLVAKNITTSIKVYPNENASKVASQLYDQKIIQHPHFFLWMLTIFNNRMQLRYGEYEIKYPMSEYQLLKHMIHGTHLVKHRLTIVEGWTFSQIRQALSADANLNQTISAESNQQILQTLKISKAHPEGLFYPNTYFFTWGNTDISVLKTAYQKMQTLLNKNWQNRAPNLPYQNAYQALIVASLIEKETSIATEKPLIASVIINRLAKNMRLQIDPTVQYGLNKTFGGSITKTDLQTKTPYNTYLMNGLPPTPICMPSESSIQAALHPATTDYLYYVATGNGGHYFSKTYAEHLKQVEEYRNVMKSTS